MKAIKNARLKKQKKKRLNAQCLASNENSRLVHAGRQKEKDQRNVCLGYHRVVFDYLICLLKNHMIGLKFYNKKDV